MTGPLFYVAEISYRGFDGTTGTILVSDLGYKTDPTDSVKHTVMVYPPRMTAAFAIDRRVNLAPDQSTMSASWGSLTLVNTDRYYDSIAVNGTSDGQRIRIYAGRKQWDGRYMSDPDFSALTLMFAGVSTDWKLSELQLEVPLRDTGYITERNFTGVWNETYTRGGVDYGFLIGQPVPGANPPKARGRVLNISPVSIYPDSRTYQWTDPQYPGGQNTLETLYENGAPTITLQAKYPDVNTFTTTTPDPGKYIACDEFGLFKLGSLPQGEITLDGNAGTYSRFTNPASPYFDTWYGLHNLMVSLLVDDLKIPSDLIDVSSFLGLAPVTSFTGGFYTGTDPVTYDSLLSQLAASVGCKIISTRTGALALMSMSPLTGYEQPSARFDVNNTVNVTPSTLDASIDPPPRAYKLEYDRNWTVQTSGLSGLVDAQRKAFLSSTSRYVSWTNPHPDYYVKPNNPGPLSCLQTYFADVQNILNVIGAMWGVKRYQFDVVVPTDTNLALDIGQIVQLKWPMGVLTNGALGRIVGLQFRSTDPTLTMQVVV